MEDHFQLTCLTPAAIAFLSCTFFHEPPVPVNLFFLDFHAQWVTPAAIKATSEDQRACLVADFKSGFWVRI
ncbi:hypothetical protein CK203_002466 [Vitis vinifera]|uniref:Uncharacterized protein n=1 Tax=Vitis vinifera TaxID=29760 RepID=A0A438KI28_VITVI|nr:hypothetical protein CK203_002466 [Vitis vinifera]